MGHTRRALMSVYESAVDGVLDLKRNEAHGQDDLFGDWGFGEGGETDPVLVGSVPDLPDWDKRTKLAFERDMLGLYVSDHPLQGLEHILTTERDIGIAELLGDDGPREGMVTIAGMITSVTRKTTKRGDIWAVISVEDLEASVEVLLFPKAYDLVSTVLATDTVVKVKGRIKSDDDAVSINAQELTLPDISDAPSGPVVISLPAVRCTPPVVQQLRDVLGGAPGDDRGAAPAAVLGQDHGDEARPAAPGDAVPAADGRPEGAARTVVSGVMTSPESPARPGPELRTAGRLVCFVALALGAGAVAGAGLVAGGRPADLPGQQRGRCLDQ